MSNEFVGGIERGEFGLRIKMKRPYRRVATVSIPAEQIRPFLSALVPELTRKEVAGLLLAVAVHHPDLASAE